MVAHQLLLFTEQSFVHLCYYALVEIWIFAAGDSGNEVFPVLGQLVLLLLISVSKVSDVAVVLVLQITAQVAQVLVVVTLALLWVITQIITLLVKVWLIEIRLAIVVVESILLLLVLLQLIVLQLIVLQLVVLRLVVALVEPSGLPVNVWSIHLARAEVVADAEVGEVAGDVLRLVHTAQPALLWVTALLQKLVVVRHSFVGQIIGRVCR